MSSTWNLVVDILQQKIDYHTHYIIIVSFVDPKIPTHFLLIGLCLLQCNKLGSHQFWMDIVQGFMHMSSTMLEGTKSLSMLTPHKMSWGMVIYHEWVLIFNPNFSHGLKFFVWCSLKTLQLKYKYLEKTSVAHVRNILCEVMNSHKRRDPRLCIAMNLEQGWGSTLVMTFFILHIKIL